MASENFKEYVKRAFDGSQHADKTRWTEIRLTAWNLGNELTSISADIADCQSSYDDGGTSATLLDEFDRVAGIAQNIVLMSQIL